MAKHALLSASGAHRWLLCTPSAQLEQKFPASTSAYAEEGTVAHALAELTTRYFLGELDEVSYENQIKSEFEPNSYYNAEMRECAVAYAKFVTGRLAEAKKTCPDAMIILETRLDFSKYVPGGFGTGDCVIIAEPILDVIDFKYGKGHRVEAEDNPQMQLYGLGALEQFGDLYEIKTVRMTIFQPRLSGIEDSSEKTVKELTSWGKSYVKPRAKLADKGEGDFAPSEEACRFCRAKNQCRARAEENLKLFDESPDPLLISPEEAGAILAKSADIETWLKDLRELVSGALTAGETVTGWKMVEGRSNRKFADEDKVVAAMKAAGYAWCDCFVDYCFIYTFGLELGMAMTFQPKKGAGAGCTYSMGYYKKAGRFFKDPQPGDQIFFTNDGGASSYHTGLVEKVEGGRVYTIEGNTSSAPGVVPNGGAVRDKSYSLGYNQIAGYGRPDWSLAGEET